MQKRVRGSEATPFTYKKVPVMAQRMTLNSVRCEATLPAPPLSLLSEPLLPASLLPSSCLRSDFPLSGCCFQLQNLLDSHLCPGHWLWCLWGNPNPLPQKAAQIWCPVHLERIGGPLPPILILGTMYIRFCFILTGTAYVPNPLALSCSKLSQ